MKLGKIAQWFKSKQAGWTGIYKNKDIIKSMYSKLELTSTDDNRFKKPLFNKIDRDIMVLTSGKYTKYKVTYKGSWYELEKSK